MYLPNYEKNKSFVETFTPYFDFDYMIPKGISQTSIPHFKYMYCRKGSNKFEGPSLYSSSNLEICISCHIKIS